jgi:hypothetical protein
VTAILWAGVPGQESGNSITDILYGKINPAARSPFTWGPTRESYGTDILYTPNNGNDAPQDDFIEGNMIDYRAFDKQNITPIYFAKRCEQLGYYFPELGHYVRS